MIAPFWADVDTRNGGAVYTASPDANTRGIVPEPETYAMLLAGLGVVGFIARRSKRLQRFA